MYYIYFKRANGAKFTIGANIFLRAIDQETIRCIDRNHLLANATKVDALPLDLSEKAYIWKQTEDENIDYGEVLYSDSADIADIDGNRENIIQRFDNKENMHSFLEKYLELTYGKGINEDTSKEVLKILSLLDEKKDALFPFITVCFQRLIDNIFNEYETYRFAYIANKTIPIKRVNCIRKKNYW